MGTISAIRACVLSGEGLAVLPRYLVQADLSDGLLAEVWPDRPLVADWFRLLFRANDPRAPFFRALGQAMRGHQLQ